MADKLAFELVSPERRLAGGPADQVTIPGMEGDLTALLTHASFLTTLRPGVLVVTDGGNSEEYFVTGGFAEIAGDTVSVLAEEALPRAEVNREWIDARMQAAEQELADAPDDRKRAAGQRVMDFRNIIEQLAL